MQGVGRGEWWECPPLCKDWGGEHGRGFPLDPEAGAEQEADHVGAAEQLEAAAEQEADRSGHSQSQQAVV